MPAISSRLSKLASSKPCVTCECLFSCEYPSTSQEDIQRRAIKSKNTSGDPIRLASKLLAVIADPAESGQIYVAESAGTVRRVVLEVGKLRQE